MNNDLDNLPRTLLIGCAVVLLGIAAMVLLVIGAIKGLLS